MLATIVTIGFVAMIFFLGKTYILYDKLKALKCENKILKGKVVKLIETRDIGSQVIYIYSIEIDTDATNKKCYTYYEIVNKASKLNVDMKLDVYFNEEPIEDKVFKNKISLVKDIKKRFWISLLLFGVFAAIMCLLYIIDVIII